MKTQIVLVILLVIFPFFSRPAQSAALNNDANQLHVQWIQQRLSVKANAAPLAKVIHSIAEKTGLVVHGDHLLKGETAANFPNLPLQDALATLLHGFSYAFQEPSILNDFRYVLSIVSSRSETGSIKSTIVENSSSPLLPAYAGYVPEQYRYIYEFAQHGDIDNLRQVASSGDEAAQALALKLLTRKYPAEAVGVAAEAITSPDSNRRLNAVQLVGELDNAGAAKILGQALQDSDIGIRQAAVMGLQGQTSPESIPLLIEALQDKAASIRLLALDILAEKGARGADGIKEALQSSDLDLRNHAHELLERLADAE